MPVEQLHAGMTGTGYTVSKGTEPEPFDVEVLGVLHDALAPGKDMIIVETSGPALDKAGGVWFGMSGSPVYIDNNLLGAVAFGLGFGPSKLAGLTPAEDMYKILDYAEGGGPDDRRLPDTVRLSASERKVIAKGAGMAADEVQQFDRLKVPFSVSGASGRILDKMREAAERENLDLIPYAGGSSTSAAAAESAPKPGGNFAAALSYGDVTAAGIGTTTAVCGDKVLAFGHPFTFEGKTTMGASNADAITIWDDPVFGPFKLANVTGAIGTVDQDRMSGIRGLIGPLPATIPITSTVTSTTNGNSREGRTEGLLSEPIPFLTVIHMVENIDVVFDEVGEGSSELTWTITGTTESGEEWELNRSNMFISDYDIAYDSVFELEEQLFTLFYNEFDEVDFTGVDVDATVHGEVRQYAIGDLSVARNGGVFKKTKHLSVRRGDTVNLRVVLEPYDGSADKSVDLSVKIPKKARGPQLLQIRGGNIYGGGVFCFFDSDCSDEYGNKIDDFDALIKALENQSKNNQVRALMFGRRKLTAHDEADMDQVVLGHKRVRLSVH
jgi:SpoIVB peptidase S55